MRATYRLQVNRFFTLSQAASLLDYFSALGVSHLYLSPIFTAHPGSLHGYDVVDPTSVNPEIGGERAFARLAEKSKKRGIGLILDIVPNHMGVADEANPWWNDVVRKGKSSPYARVFDIDWNRSPDADGRLHYRRFCDIGGLAAVREEDPWVFDRMHKTVLDWVRKGWIQGLRIDHPDGLRDPRVYLKRLVRKTSRGRRPFYLIVEKILNDAEGERLPADWPVDGTTGYETLNLLNALFVDPGSREEFLRSYRKFAGVREPWRSILRRSKRLFLETTLADDLDRLTRRRPGRKDAVKDKIASLAVYRNYRPGDDFSRRLQQLSVAVMAKGLEDTALYRFFPLASLNEVGGGRPDRFGIAVAYFHQRNVERLKRHPYGLVATSTHDTKRGEDVRARIHVLSEIPKDWFKAVGRWMMMNRHLEAIDRNQEYLFYQTLIGTWPGVSSQDSEWKTYIDRIAAYLLKAAHEAKQNTDWTEPNADYEWKLDAFVRTALDRRKSGAFLRDFEGFHIPVARAGKYNSLAQTLLKMTIPGVPDFYQGTELWESSLVDPDNRRPVDFRRLRALLASLPPPAEEDRSFVRDQIKKAASYRDEGLLKMYVIRQSLSLRAAKPELFAQGAYLPFTVLGELKNHVIAFGRVRKEQAAFVSVARLTIQMWRMGPWKNTRVILKGLPPGLYRNRFTGEELEIRRDVHPLKASRLFEDLPIALWERRIKLLSCETDRSQTDSPPHH